MKRFILCLLALSLVAVWADISNAEISKKKAKFKATFTITFNELTLEEARQKEDLLRNVAGDACKLDIDLNQKSSDGSFDSDGGIYFTSPTLDLTLDDSSTIQDN